MKAAKQRSAWAHCVAYGGVPRLTGGHDQNIRQLKSFLRESPRPGRRQVDDSDADQSPADEAASDPESEPGPEPLVPAVEDEPSSESCASAGLHRQKLRRRALKTQALQRAHRAIR